MFTTENVGEMLGKYGNVWKAKDPRFLPATLKRQGNELVRDFSLGCRPFEGTYLTSMFDYEIVRSAQILPQVRMQAAHIFLTFD